MKLSQRSLIKAYLAYCLCMDCDVFIRIFGRVGGGGANIGGFQSANPILLMFSALLVGGTLLLLLPIHRQVLRTLLNTPWLTGLYVWAMLSVLWAVEPGNVVRLGIPLWAYMLSGIIAAYVLTLDEVIGVVGNLMFFVALASAVWEKIDPIRDSAAPGWTGVFGEKNHLGMGMGVGVLALLVAPKGAIRFRVLKIAVCGVLLAASQSATAMIFTVIAIVAYGILRTPPRLKPLAIVVLTALVVIPVLLTSNSLDRAFAAGGKSTNFTGRDVIWRLVIEHWQTRPLLGFGYDDFWTSQDSLIQQSLHWNPGSAHNGFLEVLVTLGVTGEVWLLGTLVSGILLARKAWRVGQRTAAMWLCMAWIAMVVDDITEADFMVPAPLWFIYCLVFFCAYVQVRRAKVRVAQVAFPQQVTVGAAA